MVWDRQCYRLRWLRHRLLNMPCTKAHALVRDTLETLYHLGDILLQNRLGIIRKEISSRHFVVHKRVSGLISR